MRSRAVQLETLDGLGGARLTEREVPAPGVGEVRVRMQLAGVHPLEALIAAGGIPFASAPLVPGAVGAGIVETEGERFAAGDRVAVVGNALGMVRDGVWADHAAVPEDLLLAIPDGVGLAAAACLGIAVPTAVLALERVGLGEGATLLVLGASGGVGLPTVQLAAARGIRVVGTSRTAEGAAFAACHGTEIPVDLSSTTLAEAAGRYTDGGFDGIVDPVGGAVTAEALATLKPGGTHVVLGYSAGFSTTVDLPLLVNFGRRLEGCNMNARGPEALRAAEQAGLDALAAGSLVLPVAETHPLASFAEASAAAAAPAVQGRVLLDLAA